MDILLMEDLDQVQAVMEDLDLIQLDTVHLQDDYRSTHTRSLYTLFRYHTVGSLQAVRAVRAVKEDLGLG